MTETLSELGQAAVRYGGNGFYVFPLCGGTKRPLIPAWQKAATNDAATIEMWWRQWPDANIGWVPDLSGNFILDVDTKHGAPGRASLEAYEIANGKLPDTLVIATPSGGEHRIFRGRAPTSANADGLDFRGGRGDRKGLGYGILPPSVTPDDLYTIKVKHKSADAPAALIEFASARVSRSRAPEAAGPTVDEDRPENLARARDWISRQPPIPEGSRDNTAFRHAAQLLDLGPSPATARELLGEWNARNPEPLPDEDLDRITASAVANRQNKGSTPNALDGSAAEVLGQYVADLDLIAQVAEPARDERLERFRGREADEYAALPAPSFHDDHGLLLKAPGGVVGVLAGRSGAFKTTIMLALALDAALTKGARVLYMAPEGAYGLGRLRVPAECAVRGIDPKELRGRFRQLDTAPILTDPRDVDALLEAQADFKPDLVVIDTMASAIAGLDENAAATAALLTGVGPLRRIARTWNATVMLLAHLGKDAAKGIRGSSAFHGNADTVLLVTAVEKTAGVVTLRVDKQRDAPDGFDVHFKVSHVTGGAPVARFITADQRKALSPSDPSNAQHDVFHALKGLQVHGGVSTKVLADHLVPVIEGQGPEERERLVGSEVRRLQSLVRPNRHTKRPGPLLAYVRLDHRGEPLSPFEWVFPGDPDGEAEDD